MNILLFSRICAKSGVGNHMKLLYSELVKEGHRVIVVSGTNEIGIQEDDFYQIDKPSFNPKTLLKDLLELHKIIKSNDIEVVHCHHRMAALYMRFYNMIWKVHVVYTLHLADVPCDFIHRKMTFVGDAAIGVSTEVSKFMEEKLKVTNNKITTIMNGVDVDNLLPLNAVEKLNIKKEWNIEDGKYVFVMHSRIDEVKNHLLMVEAVHSLSDEVKKRIVVVCSGTQSGDYYCQVLDRIKEYGLDDIFKFVGWVEARKILGIAGFLVLPSFNEGFALSVIEAYLMKVPVMRTKTAGFEEQKYCYPIDMYNPSDIVNIVNDIYRNGLEKYKVNVEDAYQLAINEMTSQKMTEKTVEVYMKVCSKSDKVIEATLRK